MPGETDPLYVAARRALLNALEALTEHLSSLILVGAQAVCIHAGEAELAVAPFTTDADIAIDPDRLGDKPLLQDALTAAGFLQAKEEVGIWKTSISLEGIARQVGVDLLVPASVGGPGRRGARIPPHSKLAARKVAGLEGALVDHDQHLLDALEPADRRRFEVSVAGPAALIVGKVYKILDRAGDADRSSDKDALDVLRLMRAVSTPEIERRFRVLLAHQVSSEVAQITIARLPQLFGAPNAIGCQMAAQAAAPLEDPEIIAASLAALTGDLLQALREG